MIPEHLKEFLLGKAEQYEVPDFIPDDPLSIPHRYSDRADVEVAAFLQRCSLGAIEWPSSKA